MTRLTRVLDDDVMMWLVKHVRGDGRTTSCRDGADGRVPKPADDKRRINMYSISTGFSMIQ